MTVKNSEIREWLRGMGMNLCDVESDDQLIPRISVNYCKLLGQDPNEEVMCIRDDVELRMSRSAFYELAVQQAVTLLRAVFDTCEEEADDIAE